METITLIQTELQLPRLTSDLLERPSLIQRLINGLNCKLILVATLFSKMQVANRAEAIVDAREAGLGQSDWLNLRKN